MWKRWRQTKGRRGSPTISGKIIQEDRLEKELEKVEQELRSYEEEERDRKKRKVKKAEKERHWDMMKWITAYIEENKLEWDERDKLRREVQEEEEGEETSRNQDTSLVEAKEIDETAEEKREKRIKQAQEMKERWRKWRSHEEKPTPDNDSEREEEEYNAANGKGKMNSLMTHFSGADHLGLPGQDNRPPSGSWAYQEIPLGESIAPWDAGQIADLRWEERKTEEDEWKDWQELESYRESTIGDNLCIICVAYPCLCTDRRAEERMEELRKSTS